MKAKFLDNGNLLVEFEPEDGGVCDVCGKTSYRIIQVENGEIVPGSALFSRHNADTNEHESVKHCPSCFIEYVISEYNKLKGENNSD